MKILFLHHNMPGQFKHTCQAFAKDPNNTVVFVTKPRPIDLPNIHKVEYKIARDVFPTSHRYLINAERGVLQGQEVWRICKKLRQEGFIPDVVCAHPGWGDALFIKDVYPETALLSFFEFYYRSSGSDVGFDPDDPLTEDDKARVRVKNVINLLSLENADWGLTPTHWQHIQHPKEFLNKISVIHDGIDTDYLQPNAATNIKLPSGQILTKQDEVITYVARNFEPYRGFPTFMQAAEIILRNRPKAHIIAIGADDVSYGKRPKGNKTYRQEWLGKVKIDESRLHFVGTVAYPNFIKLLQTSSAHIYLTYPFVLSWSMLEAMSMECLIIGSSTPPVTEVIKDNVNGLLVDFFSPEDVARRIDEVFAHKDRMADIRKNARKTVLDRYALSKLLPLHVSLIKDVAARQFPPPTAARINALYDEKKAA